MAMSVSFKHNTSSLSTTVTISDQHGKRSVNLGALEVIHKLSPSGRFLVLQLAASKSDDSGKFIKIDTLTGERLFTVSPEWGWVKDCSFQGEDEELIVAVEHGKYLVNHDGSLVDRPMFYANTIAAADTSAISALPDFFELHGKTESTVKTALASMDNLLEKCVTQFHGKSWGASALKEKSELLTWQGRDGEALQVCVDALALDPKATVKRTLNSISKKLGIDKSSLAPSDWAVAFRTKVDLLRESEMSKSKEEYDKFLAHGGDKTIVNITQPSPDTSSVNAANKTKSTRPLAVIFIILVIATIAWAFH